MLALKPKACFFSFFSENHKGLGLKFIFVSIKFFKLLICDTELLSIIVCNGKGPFHILLVLHTLSDKNESPLFVFHHFFNGAPAKNRHLRAFSRGCWESWPAGGSTPPSLTVFSWKVQKYQHSLLDLKTQMYLNGWGEKIV